jgi:hypothetical protein
MPGSAIHRHRHPAAGSERREPFARQRAKARRYRWREPLALPGNTPLCAVDYSSRCILIFARKATRAEGGFQAGWGTWIRTKTNRVRVCCATVTPFPNGLPSVINSLCGYPGKSHAAGSGQSTARWSQRSTRLILPLASAEAGAFFCSSALPGRPFPGDMPKQRR